MTEVRITRAAGNDLDSIQAYGLAEFGPAATREYMEGFDRILLRLGHYPLAGAMAPDYGRSVRACLHAPYRVYYRFEGDIVWIMRVLHTARRPHVIDDTLP